MREVFLQYDESILIDQLPSGLHPLHHTWETISHIADLALVLYNHHHTSLNHGVDDDDNDDDQLISVPSSLLNHNIDNNTDSYLDRGSYLDPYYAGFMGAASQSLCDNFSTSTIVDNNKNNDDNNNIIRLDTEIRDRLWNADIELSTILIKNASTLGIIAYISSPIHNDRNDWGNLVIAKNEESILKWRDSQHHSFVRANIAPYCYDHIRLHRGILKHGLIGKRLGLERTLFLGPVEKAINRNDDVDYDHDRIQSRRKHFEKHLTYWNEIPSISLSSFPLHGDSSNDHEDNKYDRVVPGAGALTLNQCKAKLLENGCLIYIVMVDQTTILS